MRTHPPRLLDNASLLQGESRPQARHQVGLCLALLAALGCGGGNSITESGGGAGSDGGGAAGSSGGGGHDAGTAGGGHDAGTAGGSGGGGHDAGGPGHSGGQDGGSGQGGEDAGSAGGAGGSAADGSVMDGGRLGGSRDLFEQAEPWTKVVSGLQKSADSDAIIGALSNAGGWGTTTFNVDDSIYIFSGDASTPKRTFTAKDDAWSMATFHDTDHTEFFDPDCDRVSMPVPTGGAVEGENGYSCTMDGDCHLLVVMTNEKKLYEMWRADISGGTFLGGCLAVWDLTKTYGSTLRGKGCTSADAGGFPLTAMLATADEAAAGEIKHALRFILPNGRIRRGIYVAPGTHSTFSTSGGNMMPPYGVRFRLKASYDETSLPSRGAQILARALKSYGMFLADGGNVPLTIASDRFSQHKWSETHFSVQDLKSIKVTDFEVVDEGAAVNWRNDTTCYRNP